MTWKDALSNLAALSVSGVNTSYDSSNLPNTLAAADLPALAPAFPEGTGESDPPGLSVLTYDGAAWRAGLEIDHVLYWSPAWSEAGLRTALPDLLDALEAYLNAVRADGTLGGALDAELTISAARPGVVSYGGVRYLGITFRHRWERVIG
jgi:hypothetical protein